MTLLTGQAKRKFESAFVRIAKDGLDKLEESVNPARTISDAVLNQNGSTASAG
jgi:hypothetical protein